jgi:hypothetical protein
VEVVLGEIRVVTIEHVVDSLYVPAYRVKFRENMQRNGTTVFLQDWDVSEELDRVSQSLLAVDDDVLAVDRINPVPPLAVLVSLPVILHLGRV